MNRTEPCVRLFSPDRLKAFLPAVYVDLATVAAGNLTRNGLRGVTKLLVAGFLGPRGLGVLRSIYAIFRLVSGLVDFGLNYAVLSMVPAAAARNRSDEGDRILKAVLGLRLLVSGAFVTAGCLFAGPIAGFLGDPGLVVWVRLAFVAVIGQSLWKFLQGMLSTRQQYGRVALMLTTAPVMLLAAVGLLIALDHFDLPKAIVLYLSMPALTVALWWWSADRGFLRVPWSGETARRVLRFGRWVYVSRIAMSSLGQINPLMLKSPRLSGSLAAGELNAGLYAFGNELADELTVLSESLYVVLMPRAGGKTSPAAMRGFVRRCYRNLALLAIPLLLPFFLFKPFLMLLGMIKQSYLAYLPSYEAFVILYAAGLLSLAIIPMRSALYAMELPHVDSYLEAAGVVLLVLGGIVLIPRYGYVGAAVMAFVVRAMVLVGLVAYGTAKLNTRE